MHILTTGQDEVARTFATKGAEKFAGDAFTEHPDGLPALARATVRPSCTVEHVYPAGEHAILIGRVRGLAQTPERPAVYLERTLHMV